MHRVTMTTRWPTLRLVATKYITNPHAASAASENTTSSLTLGVFDTFHSTKCTVCNTKCARLIHMSGCGTNTLVIQFIARRARVP
jgi:hypothetical protein